MRWPAGSAAACGTKNANEVWAARKIAKALAPDVAHGKPLQIVKKDSIRRAASSAEDIATEMEDDRRFASLERVYRPDPDA
jgi:hypothetical protein